jgi:WD40 repeat protein
VVATGPGPDQLKLATAEVSQQKVSSTTVHTHDLLTGIVSMTGPFPGGSNHRVALSEDGSTLFVYDGVDFVHIRSLTDLNLPEKKVRIGPGTSIAFSNVANLAAIWRTRRGFSLVSLDTGEPQGDLVGVDTQFKQIFSRDGRSMVSAGTATGLLLWNLASKEPRLTIQTPPGRLVAGAFSADGRTLVGAFAQGNSTRIALWSGEPSDR